MAEKRENKLNKKLAAYSATAAAALAMAPAANAAIVYSGVQNITVDVGQDALIDMDGSMGNDFRFWNSYISPAWLYLNLDSSGYNGSGFIETFPPVSDPANLPYGYSVRQNLSYPYYWIVGNGHNTLYGISFFFGNPGNFDHNSGYLGVRFQSACGQTFGWIQFTHLVGPEGIIVDWAYEDVCGTPIQTGAVSANVVPTMGEWGMLALAGLLSAISIKAINREEETA